ncbi:MAG: hypothetical protein J07HX64_00286 [halophilic archaeon J07HX64]|jgi:Uncharacterized membrane-associated protein/domain|nr:MAG: hypothetical protein J07HX64_00286 [halophilic archaeon J07HX64]
MRSAVSEAENLTRQETAVTEREMTATGFEAETGTEVVPREWGFVTYRFNWEGFAPVDNGTVSVGDTFEDGLFLEENSILVIRSPDGYEATTVEPDPDQVGSNELRWEGPVEFGDRRPTAEFVQSGSPDDSTDGADGTGDGSTGSDADDSPGNSGGDGSGGLPGSVLFGTAGVAVLAGVTALYLHQRRQQPDSAGQAVTDDGQEPDTAVGTAETHQERKETETATNPGEVPELATDEDRVIAALEVEGGRMKQSDLADQLDWSPSKASRVLSDMADEGEIEKLRIGRENVIDRVSESER